MVLASAWWVKRAGGGWSPSSSNHFFRPSYPPLQACGSTVWRDVAPSGYRYICIYRGRLSVLVIDFRCFLNSCAEMEMSDVPVQYALMERLQALDNLDPQSETKVGSFYKVVWELLELMYVEGSNIPDFVAFWVINIFSGPVSCGLNARQDLRAY